MSEFDQGYICAITAIVAIRGKGTETSDALKAIGITSRKLAKSAGADVYDLRILDSTLKELERKK